MAFVLADVVDLKRYPIDQPGSPEYQAAVADARAGLRSAGCAVSKDFVRTDALALLAEEIRARKPATHYSIDSINPYFHTEFNADYPECHPVNTFIERSSGFIPGDSWESSTLMRSLFEAPALARFLADCLEIDVLYPFADPLAGLTTNVLDPGQQFTWHFDTNEFAVTVLIDAAEEGGLFEYVPGIRSEEDECFGAVQAILDGGRDNVNAIDLRPGDLQIFRGRHSLHRVTRVAADSPARHAAIFAYTKQPGVIGRLDRTQQLFGRVLPVHVAAEEERVRADELLD